MALTEAQIRSCFEMLDTPYSTSFNTMDGMGTLSSQTDVSGSTTGQAKTAITTAIAAFTSDTETKVTALITAWDEISLNVGTIQSGGVSDVQGLSFSFEDKRNLIRNRLQTYLPFYKFHEVLKKQQGGRGYVTMIR